SARTLASESPTGPESGRVRYCPCDPLPPAPSLATIMYTTTPSRAYRARTGDAAVSSSAWASNATSVPGAARGCPRRAGDTEKTIDDAARSKCAGSLIAPNIHAPSYDANGDGALGSHSRDYLDFDPRAFFARCNDENSVANRSASRAVRS